MINISVKIFYHSDRGIASHSDPLGSGSDTARIEIVDPLMSWKQSARLRAEGIWTPGQRVSSRILVDRGVAATSLNATA